MTLSKKFEKELRREWYVQGLSAVPLYLNCAGWSGIAMQKVLGFCYTRLLYIYKDGYGAMWYWLPDFSRIWGIIRTKLAKDPRYLEKQRRYYDVTFRQYELFFRAITLQRLRRLDDDALLSIFKRCAQAQSDSVGAAHMIEAMSMELEKEMKFALAKLVTDPRSFNHYFVVLTTPEKLSFIAREEDALRRIGKLRGKRRFAQLKKHAERYYWLQNSYLGAKKSTASFFTKRIAMLGTHERAPFVIREKERVLTQLRSPKSMRDIIAYINFVTEWQDERKMHILQSIHAFSTLVDEIVRRTRVPRDVLHYMSMVDIMRLPTLRDIRVLKKEYLQRKQGSFFLMEGDQEWVVSGPAYRRLAKVQKKLKGMHTSDREVRGTIANGGSAVGRVVVCRDARTLSRVRSGDVLVASMTRPEYMSALRKVAAIVTNEGGITCHAAVISRELGIPCIIGTKVATQILQDDMLVEVKGNHGVVKILS